MEILRIFPTAVGVFNDIDMSNKIYPVAKSFLDNDKNLTYAWNYKNTYGNVKINQSEETKFISEFILNKTFEYLKYCGFKNVDLNVSLFFSEMYKGDTHIKHVHPHCIFSGVFYLKVPEGSSQIVFYDPAPQKEYGNPPIDILTDVNSPTIEISPKEGMLLLFPSWIQHEVKPNCSIEPRTTVVFNLEKK